MKKIGKEVLILTTGTGNPRNSEGSFLRRKDGSILFGFTEYTGDSSKLIKVSFRELENGTP